MQRLVDLEGTPRGIELTDDTQHLSTLDGESTRLDTFLWQRSNDRIWLEQAYELTEHPKQTI